MTEFESKAEVALSRLQKAISSVIHEYGDPSVIRPVDVSEIMGIDMNLAWKLTRLVNSTDVFSTGKYLPGRKALGNFCRKARNLKCSEEKISALRNASANLENLIRTFAGTRKQLGLMLANLSVEERTANDIIHRRKSFEGNRYTFGVQSEVQLSSMVLMPAESGKDLMDICRIKGHIGLFLTRPKVPWRIATTNIIDSEGRLLNTPQRHSLFPVSEDEPSLVREFCSKSIPHFQSSTSRSGKRSYFISGEEMGITSSVNIFTAEVLKDAGALYRINPNDGAALNNSSLTPTKKLVAEVFIPEEFGTTAIEVEMWSRLFGTDDMSDMIQGDLLPLNQQPILYPPGRGPVPVPAIPDYSRMIQSCFKALNKNLTDFRLVRLAIDFPPIPASIDILVGLPDRSS